MMALILWPFPVWKRNGRGRVPATLRAVPIWIAVLASPCATPAGSGDERRVTAVYRVNCGEQNGCRVWIVDGAVVRRAIDPEFLFGGNGQRYLYVPPREIWVDHVIAAEEFGYTVAHELREREEMARKGATYDEGHERATAVERQMRQKDRQAAEAHEARVPRVSPTDCDGHKKYAELPDVVALHRVYRTFLGKRAGFDVWIVDGAAVRRDIYPDFVFSGNDLTYHFIPAGELWIDGQVSCEETEFLITGELHQRAAMARGGEFGETVAAAARYVAIRRDEAARVAQRMAPVVIPASLRREVGSGDEKAR